MKLLHLIAIGLALGSSAARAQEAGIPADANAAAPEPQAEHAGEKQISDEVLRSRDPFLRPAVIAGPNDNRSELEMFPLEQLRLVGIITGPNKMRAMLVAPNGKTYLVFENMKIGLRRGVVRKITSRAVFIREKIVNLLGKEEILDVQLRLADG